MAGYTDQQAKISLELSQNAYCGHGHYLSHTYTGAASGFVATKSLYSGIWQDTEGFVGYLPSDSSIYVSFRGSLTIQNWITDLSIAKTKYNSFPDCNCEVHSGFYGATMSVFPDVLAEVKRLQSLHKTYAVKVTGHSLGGALAQLTSMELIKNGIHATMINFGQPRVGDDAYAAYSNKKLT